MKNWSTAIQQVNVRLPHDTHTAYFAPIIISYAPQYFSPVISTTSSSATMPSFPFNPLLTSQSRKNCLSKLSCPRPTSCRSKCQNLDESGVKTSSASTISSVASSSDLR